MPPQIYQFEPDLLEERGYKSFPDALENDDLVHFHATAGGHVANIVSNGFKSAAQLGLPGLDSISWAKNSAEALNHWIAVRKKDGIIRDGVILAVRFGDRTELYEANGTTYSRSLKVQPDIIGQCPVPSTYRHV